MLINKNDAKVFHDKKTTVISTSDGGNTWAGRIVVGQSIPFPSTGGVFEVYEAMGFNKVQTQTQLFDIYDKVFGS